MRQASLFDHCAPLTSAMPAIKAAMRAVAGAPEGEGRKALPDKINAVASASGVKLTTGNTRSISKDTLDKWLSPSDENHPPSLLAVLAFCLATESPAPLRAMLRPLGLDIMTEEDRKLCEYARTLIEQKKMRKRLRKLEDEL